MAHFKITIEAMWSNDGVFEEIQENSNRKLDSNKKLDSKENNQSDSDELMTDDESDWKE